MSLSLIRNLRRRKFKAILRPLYDSTYRKDLNRMREVLGTNYYSLKQTTVPLYLIHGSHGINYPDWVDHIVDQINGWEGLYTPPPIKVVLDKERSERFGQPYYLVIDGNHRLMAMKRTMSPGQQVAVLEMIEEA